MSLEQKIPVEMIGFKICQQVCRAAKSRCPLLSEGLSVQPSVDFAGGLPADAILKMCRSKQQWTP